MCVPQVDAEELERRQQYLKKQRDKLLALKKNERQKKLKAAEVESVARPKSARVAQAALAGQQERPSQALSGRRVLAERLRSEVVGRIWAQRGDTQALIEHSIAHFTSLHCWHRTGIFTIRYIEFNLSFVVSGTFFFQRQYKTRKNSKQIASNNSSLFFNVFL